MKEKFPCLNYLRLNPVFAGKVVVACAIFHNIAIKVGREEIVVPRLDENDDDQNILPMNVETEVKGNVLHSFLEYFQPRNS